MVEYVNRVYLLANFENYSMKNTHLIFILASTYENTPTKITHLQSTVLSMTRLAHVGITKKKVHTITYSKKLGQTPPKCTYETPPKSSFLHSIEVIHPITLLPFVNRHNDDEQFWSNATVDDWAKEMAGMRIIVEKYANLTDNSVVGVRSPYLRVGGNNQFTMMEEQSFLYDSTITAPLSNPPLWPYTMYFRMPHRCHGNLQHCPTRSHAVWEMVLNELDRREDPNFDEYLPGCAMVDSCSNILSGDQFYNFLNHNFDRHYDQNRAPLGLYFHAAWLKNNPEYLDAFLFWMDEILRNHNDVYFVTMTQVIQWIQNPRTVTETKNFDAWKEKCVVEGNPACWVPHSCKLTSKEVPGETINLQTCVRCPNNYPWINDPTGDGFF